MKCKDCKNRKLVEGTGSRCRDCFRKVRAGQAARWRKQLREKQVASNAKLLKSGRRICARCLGRKRLTEFGTSLNNRKGKLNKICDRCLTAMYEKRGTWYTALRARAYSLNNVARQRLARERSVPTSEVQLSDLPRIIKPQELAGKLQTQGSRCGYCSVELTVTRFTADHSMPLSRGGSHSLRNLILCCPDCNRLKHTRTKKEFLLFLKYYLKRDFLS